MVITANTPAITHRFKDVTTIIAVLILDTGYFTALGGIEPTIIPVKANGFVQATGIQLNFHLTRFTKRITDSVDVTTATTNGKFAIGHDLKPTCLQHDPLGDGDFYHAVIIVLGVNAVLSEGVQSPEEKSKAKV